MKPQDFITGLTPAAIECEKAAGIPHAFTLAQGALESAWGGSVLATKGFNLFGVKADASWHGATLVLPTKEHLSGKDVTVVAKWRKYANWDECILDHAKFFHANPRYAQALKTTDPIEFARRVAAAGYATDPKYADKLIAIMKSNNLVGV
jgi:flagellar rod assembly protein/muramidase FlgJ